MIKSGDEPIPGYRVEELLGRGQFGQVWRARSPGQTSVALKFLELSDGHGWKEFRAIQRVKQIRHAHLMPIVAIWLLDHQGQVISDDAIDSIAASYQNSYKGRSAETLVVRQRDRSSEPAQMIVATLLANQTLGDRLKQCQDEGMRGIPVDELLGYMEEAAKGLDFLNSTQHKIGTGLGAVQHCDVKPDNIMLTGGSVVISDFGVAQVLAQSLNNATATSMGGTPAYMAPECFVNKPCECSDQYSLAVTYYELRTGELPFAEHTYAAVYQAHKSGTLDFSFASPPEQQVLRRATSTDPNKRFKSCAELVEKLQQAFHPQEPSSGRGALFAAGAALIALLAASVGWLLWPPNPTPVHPHAALARIVLSVEPPDAQVSVDGKRVTANSAGRIAFDAEVGRTVTVAASSPERLDGKLVFETKRGEQNHKLELHYSAAHYAAQRDRFLEAGKFDDAAAALAEAIKLEPEQYSAIPQPETRLVGDGAVTCLRAAPDGRSVIAGSRGGAVTRWSIDGDEVAASGELLHQQAAEVAALSVSAGKVASIAEDGNRILLSGNDRETIELTVPDSAARIAQVVTTGGGRWLVAATEVLEVLSPPIRRITALHAWDLQAPDPAASHKELLVQDGETDPRLAGAHQEAWIVLATSPRGKPRVVRQCFIESGDSRVLHEQPGQVEVIAVSQDDRRIAVGGGAALDEGDLSNNRATLIDAASHLLQIAPLGHTDAISTLSFDATGNYLATGSYDGDAQAWSIPANWTAAEPLSDPAFMHHGQAPIESVACPRAGWVICAYSDKAALWDGQHATHKPLWLPQLKTRITAVAVTPDERWIVTSHLDGSLRFWPAERLMLLLRACIAAGVEPKARAEELDRVTHCVPPAWPRLDSPWEMRESARRLLRRPNAALAG